MNQAAPLVASVLAHYPHAIATAQPHALGNAGGFSGARLWQLRTAERLLVLRAWPLTTPPEQLALIHTWLHHAAPLGFVPRVLTPRAGPTWVTLAGRLWDVTTWLPGQADFHDDPSAARLSAACTAVAHLHRVWDRLPGPRRGPIPAVERRWRATADWQVLVRSGWRPLLNDNRPWSARAAELWSALPERIARVPARLAPWLDISAPLQPCVGDLWHDHVLYEGERISGLIDFGAARRDHVAADLARLLGSLVDGQATRIREGLTAYEAERPLPSETEALVGVLDETGTILAAANWLRWLYHDGRVFDDATGVARRLGQLAERLRRLG